MSGRYKNKGDGENYDANRKKLTKMLKSSENKYCADCGVKGPRWASTNLGIFATINFAELQFDEFREIAYPAKSNPAAKKREKISEI